MSLLAWERAGTAGGPPVVLVHSWAGDRRADWQASGWVAALERAGLGLYLPDLPGHGESAAVRPPGGEEPAGWTAAALLEDLSRLGVDRFATVGYADGCLAAGHVAARAPERVRRLVLVGCDDRRGLPPARQTAAALRDPAASVWDPDVADAVARVRRDRRHHLPTLADWVERAAWPAAARLGALRLPVLLAVAADDTEGRERAPRLARLFHDARLVTVPGDRAGMLASARLLQAATGFLADRAGPATGAAR